MGGPYTGVVNIADPCGDYACVERSDKFFKPVYVELDSQMFDTYGLDQNCFTKNVLWINGLLSGIQKSLEISEKVAQFQVKSYFVRLSEKVINSHHMTEGARTVLNELATLYATLPAALVDFSETLDDPICGPVSGNSMIAEMHLIAQAGKSQMFVNQSGYLVTKAWYDPTAAVDVTIPGEVVISAERNQAPEVIPSRVTIRGAYYSSLEKGVRDLSGGSPGGGGGQPTKADRVICAKNPFEDSEFNFVFNSLQGGLVDLRNAAIELDNGQLVPLSRANLSPYELSVYINGPSGAYLGAGDHEVTARVLGRVRDPRETQPLFNGRGILGTGIFDPVRYIQMFPYLVQAMYPGISLTSAASGGGGSTSANQEHDVPDLLRKEMIVTDPDLKEEYGIVTDELENVYVKNKERLFDILVAYFQETKMNRDPWQITTTYIPCLEIGQKVSVELPATLESGGCTITGQLSQIQLNYETGPKATMKLTVLSDALVGDTKYTSQNLLDDPDLLGYGERWTYSVSSGASVYIFNGEATLATDPGETAELTVNQPYATTGRRYFLSYDLTEISGSSVTVTVEGVNNGVIDTFVVTETGSYTHQFTSNDIELDITWSTGDSSDNTWTLSNPSLITEVTA